MQPSADTVKFVYVPSYRMLTASEVGLELG